MAAELDLDDVAAQSAKAKRELEELRDLLSATADALDYLTGMTQQQAAALRKDAERYRKLRRGQHWSVVNGIGDVLRGDELDAVVDAVPAVGAA